MKDLNICFIAISMNIELYDNRIAIVNVTTVVDRGSIGGTVSGDRAGDSSKRVGSDISSLPNKKSRTVSPSERKVMEDDEPVHCFDNYAVDNVKQQTND